MYHQYQTFINYQTSQVINYFFLNSSILQRKKGYIPAELVDNCNAAKLNEDTDAYKVDERITHKGKNVTDNPKIKALVANYNREISEKCTQIMEDCTQKDEQNDTDMDVFNISNLDS